MEAALSRGDLTDSEWRILDPLLPNRGERGPAIADKRRTVNGILWVLRTGAPWRDMPERYGNWNSVFVRFTRWSKLGVWDAAFEMLTQSTTDVASLNTFGRNEIEVAPMSSALLRIACLVILYKTNRSRWGIRTGMGTRARLLNWALISMR